MADFTSPFIFRSVVDSKLGLREANRMYAAGEFAAALLEYRRLASEDAALRGALRYFIEVCEGKVAGHVSPAPTIPVFAGAVRNVPHSAFPGMHGALPDAQPSITITLTTIGARLSKLRPVIESLVAQELQPARILLNVSTEPYLLDDGISRVSGELAELRELPKVEVAWVENLGSYRKIVPFLQRHFEADVARDEVFVTVDDDTLYPPHFLSTLYREYCTHNCVVAFRGRHMEFEGSRLARYSKWKWGSTEPSLRNLPTGKDGILYSTKFFTREFLDVRMAVALAPTADDLWIKWHVALNGVPSVILNPEACVSDYKSFPLVDYSPEYYSVSLFATHNAGAAQGKNDLAVHALERHFAGVYGYTLSDLCTGLMP